MSGGQGPIVGSIRRKMCLENRALLSMKQLSPYNPLFVSFVCSLFCTSGLFTSCKINIPN